MISIIVPVYNASKSIEACVKSIQQQDFTDWELLLVNDGSSDDSLAVIQELARVLKRGGILYLEFEASGSVEYIFSKSYFKDKGLVKSKYFGKDHIFWLYSYRYIRKLLRAYKIEITEKQYMHILSTFVYRLIPIENFAGRFGIFDKYLQNSTLKKHAANIVFEAVKEG